MNRLIIIACILMTCSGCGLFKKVKKDTIKIKAEAAEVVREEIRTEEKKDVLQIKSTDEETGTEVEFEVIGNVRILPSGEITGDQAKGSLKSNRKASGKEETSDRSLITANADRTEEGASSVSIRDTERISEPDTKAIGIVVKWIIYLIGALVTFYLIRRKLF